MMKYITAACLLLAGLSLFSFTNQKKKIKSDVIGYWMDEDPANPNFHIKVLEENGKFCELHIQKGVSTITHKGKYEVLEDGKIKEVVTDQSIYGKWDLKNKTFITRYDLSKDKKRMAQYGVVISKDGADTLRWTSRYKRMEIP